MIKIFYHEIDFDGVCSAEIFRKFCIANGKECELHGFNYGKKLPQLNRDDIVVLLDISLESPQKTIEIARSVQNMIWIDHHESALSKPGAEQLDALLPGIREVGKASCELTWDYCFRGEKVPEAVRLLGRYDVMDKSSNWGDIVNFQYGLRSLTLTLDYSLWGILLAKPSDTQRHLIETIKSNGIIVANYNELSSAQTCKQIAYEAIFDKYSCIVVNMFRFNREQFASVYNPAKHDIMINYFFNGKEFIVSLYSDKVDVAKLAAQYGGGGHEGASGFQCAELPFKKRESALYNLIVN